MNISKAFSSTESSYTCGSIDFWKEKSAQSKKDIWVYKVYIQCRPIINR